MTLIISLFVLFVTFVANSIRYSYFDFFNL